MKDRLLAISIVIAGLVLTMSLTAITGHTNVLIDFLVGGMVGWLTYNVWRGDY